MRITVPCERTFIEQQGDIYLVLLMCLALF